MKADQVLARYMVAGARPNLANEMEEALAGCNVTIIALGQHGFGPWHGEEYRSA